MEFRLFSPKPRQTFRALFLTAVSIFSTLLIEISSAEAADRNGAPSAGSIDRALASPEYLERERKINESANRIAGACSDAADPDGCAARLKEQHESALKQAQQDEIAAQSKVSNTSANGKPKKDSSVEPEVQDCDDDYEEAKLTCNPASKLGMDPGTAMMLEAAIGQAAQLLQQKGNVNEQCKKAADLSKLLGAANAAKGAACKAMVSRCVDACTDDLELKIKNAKIKKLNEVGGSESHPNYIAEVRRLEGDAAPQGKKRKRQCDAFNQAAMANLMSVLQQAGQFMQANDCKNATDLKPLEIASIAPVVFPSATPAVAPTCADPNYARTAKECICAANPTDPLCITSKPGGGGGNPTGGSSTVGGTAGAAGDGGGDGPRPFDIDTGKGSTGGGGAGGYSGGGGGGFTSGGAGGAQIKPDGAGGATAGAEGESGLKGFGSAASGGGSGGSSSLGASAGGRGASSGSSGILGALKDKFNLRNKLGKGSRNPQSLLGKDGITGANGPTLWQKISTKYQEQEKVKNGFLAPGPGGT